MKQIKNIPFRTFASRFACCLAVVCLAACTQNDVPGTEDTVETPVALHITSAELEAAPASSCNASGNATTRADLTTANASIGVFRSQGTGYKAAQGNMKYKYSSSWAPAPTTDGDLATAGSQTIYLMATDANVCAYYPYNKAYTNATAIPLTSGKTTDAKATGDAADLCYAPNQTKNGANNKIDFTMKHAMAVLQLSLKRAVDAGTRYRVTSITLENQNLRTSTTINITDGTSSSANSPAGTYTWNPGTTADGLTIPTDGTVVNTYLLMVPFSPQGTSTLKMTVEGTELTAAITSQLSTLTAGKVHKLNVTLSQSKITVNGPMQVTDWAPKSLGNIGIVID